MSPLYRGNAVNSPPPLIALAFSGGLDTTFCLVWLKRTLGARVVTVTVDTGGFSPEELAEIESRALALGAESHKTIDGRSELFSRFAVRLIQGNILRGRVYPLSVAAERILQAELVARTARELGARALAHGSTSAGNDQVRFEGVFQVLVPEMKVHAPIRELGWTREKEAAYLADCGVSVPAKTTAYSINAGLWGTTVGGRETHDPWAEIPPEVYPCAQTEKTHEEKEITIFFERGIPTKLDGTKLTGVEIVSALHVLGVRFGLGRGVHLGDTILGIKGRIGFEAPAPLMLIQAHQELEKLVLTRWQSFWKNHLAEFYGQLLHEGLYFDPVMRDIEAMIESSQAQVTGEARLKLKPGLFQVTGVRSPNSLVDAADAVYGETTGLWDGAQAAGFTRLHALPMALAHRAAQMPPEAAPARPKAARNASISGNIFALQKIQP